MKKQLLVFLLAFIIGAGAVVWWKISLSPVNSNDKAVKTFVVAKGDGIKEVSVQLGNAGLIRNKIAFFIYERLFVKQTLQAGSFKLSPAMTSQEIANKLTLGTEDVWITVPEGWRREEIIEYLQKQKIATPEGAWNEEGKYFPETYLIPKQFSIDDVRKLMRKTFDEKISKITGEQLIIASMVEREAKKAEDRPLVASVIWNRLSIGMKLDIDATVQYAVGYWKKDLTIEDLAIKSPYNTYTNPGLPPTPICNPGLSVINAVLNPAKTDYLYYLTGKDGNMYYAKTIEEHNINVAKYL